MSMKDEISSSKLQIMQLASRLEDANSNERLEAIQNLHVLAKQNVNFAIYRLLSDICDCVHDLLVYRLKLLVNMHYLSFLKYYENMEVLKNIKMY